MTWPKIASLLVVFVLTLTLGYWGWDTNQMPKTSEALVHENASSNEISSSKNLRPEEVALNNESSIDLAWKVMNNIPMNNKLKQTQKGLGDDEIGKNLFDTLLANSLEGEVPGALHIREEGYKKAKQNSKATLARIKDAMAAFRSDKFAEEKLRLLDIASNLEGVDEELKELGLDTMNDNIVPKRPDPNTAKNEEELNQALSTNLNMFVPVVGLALVLGTTSNAQEAFNYTIDGIKAQPDPYVQKKMAESFVQKFPDMTQSLQDELNNSNIKVSLVPSSTPEEPVRQPSSEAPVNETREVNYLVDEAPPQTEQE